MNALAETVRLMPDGRVLLKDMLIGRVEQVMKGLVYRTWRRGEHYMVKYHGFGLSIAVIDLLMERYMKDMEVVIDYHGKRGHVLYVARLSDFIGSHDERVDDTHASGDRQKFLSIRDFRVEQPRTRSEWTVPR